MYVVILTLHLPAKYPKAVVAAATVIGLRYRSGNIIVSKCTVDSSLFLLFLLVDGFTDPKLVFFSAPYDDPRTTSREAVTDQPWNPRSWAEADDDRRDRYSFLLRGAPLKPQKNKSVSRLGVVGPTVGVGRPC